MSIVYAREKLSDAVYALATGSGRVQERLADAALILIRLKPDDFPNEELRRAFIGVKDDLTYEQPQGDEGRISATLKVTDDDDAREIARRIFTLYHAVDRLVED